MLQVLLVLEFWVIFCLTALSGLTSAWPLSTPPTDWYGVAAQRFALWTVVGLLGGYGVFLFNRWVVATVILADFEKSLPARTAKGFAASVITASLLGCVYFVSVRP